MDSYVLKIEGDTCKLYNTKGQFQRQVGDSGVVNATNSQTYVAIIYKDGYCKTYKGSSWQFDRTIGDKGAKSCIIIQDEIIVSYTNGTSKYYNLKNGAFIRSY